jgi:hypothetical protein
MVVNIVSRLPENEHMFPVERDISPPSFHEGTLKFTRQDADTAA